MVDQDQESYVSRELIKVSDVARMFDVTPATVRVWLNDGTLEGIKIGAGHYWRIPIEEAERLATKRHGDTQ